MNNHAGPVCKLLSPWRSMLLVSALKTPFLNLIYHGASMVVHLLVVKFSMDWHVFVVHKWFFALGRYIYDTFCSVTPTFKIPIIATKNDTGMLLENCMQHNFCTIVGADIVFFFKNGQFSDSFHPFLCSFTVWADDYINSSLFCDSLKWQFAQSIKNLPKFDPKLVKYVLIFPKVVKIRQIWSH